VIEKYPKQVKIVYKNFPIQSHKHSEPAAKAALAAQKQGKFWPFHDLLYAHYKDLSDKKMRDIASQLKLDMVRFEVPTSGMETEPGSGAFPRFSSTADAFESGAWKVFRK